MFNYYTLTYKWLPVTLGGCVGAAAGRFLWAAVGGFVGDSDSRIVFGLVGCLVGVVEGGTLESKWKKLKS